MGRRGQKALRVLAGIAMMVGFVLITLFVLTRFAGPWGVPYFSFTSERGSTCTNNFTGYVCTPITLAEVEFHAELKLPRDTTVVRGTYTSTHDYQLDAVLDASAAGAPEVLKSLNAAFGKCLPDQPSLLPAEGLTKICTMATGEAVAEDGQPVSRLYLVTTGLRADGTRPVALTIKSR